MRRKVLIHLIGDTLPPFMLGQIRAQLENLPTDRYVQHLVVAEPRVADRLEVQLARRVTCLRRCFGSDIWASFRLRGVLAKLQPDAVVCWDVAATEQLRIALAGTRIMPKVVSMAFSPITQPSASLKWVSNIHRLGAYIVVPSEVMATHLRKLMATVHRVAIVPPFAGEPMSLDRAAVRHQLGLVGEGPFVFLSNAGGHQDHRLGIWGCAIAQRIHPGLTVVTTPTGSNAATMYRYHQFAERVVEQDFVVVREGWDDATIAAACDVYLEPMIRTSDQTLGVLSAMSAGVPVVATGQTRYLLGMQADTLTMPITRQNPRGIAAALIRLWKLPEGYGGQVDRASAAVRKHGGSAAYRGGIVRVLEQMFHTPAGESQAVADVG